MFAKEKLKGHKITELPKPFRVDLTPYNKLDFSETVKNACYSSAKALCELKMCKVIIIGDINVGKTSIIRRFTLQAFTFNYKATIGVDFDVEQFIILNIPFNMQIWDTAGQEKFKCIASAYYRKAHVIVGVFDLTNPSSLQNSLRWFDEALKENTEKPLKFLVGTKLDIMKNSGVEENAFKMAKSVDAEYWAVSSKTGQSIKELFFRIAALSFEKIVKLEQEATENINKIELGQNLLLLTEKPIQGKKSDEEKKRKKCFLA